MHLALYGTSTVRTPPTPKTMETPPEAIPLPDPPSDGVTGLAYLPPNPSPSLLASTSWDGCIRIHDTQSRTPKATKAMECGPLLSIAAPEIGGLGSSVFAGGLNGSICMYEIPTATKVVLGRHLGSGMDNKVACSCLAPLSNLLPSSGSGSGSRDTILASAGWDARFHLWDTRMKNEAAATVILPAKAYSMDSAGGNTVAVATANRRICVIDVRMMTSSSAKATLKQDRESSLKYQTRTIRIFPDGTGFALGSIEGRVAIEYFDEEAAEKG